MSTAVQQRRSSDRLVYTLFAAALFHGVVILGVTFDVGPSRPVTATPLRVVLSAPTQQPLTPEERAIYLAAEDQRGAGTPAAETDGGTLTPATPLESSGATGGEAPEERERASNPVPTEKLVSPAEAAREVAAPPDASERPDTQPLSARIQQVAPPFVFQRRDTFGARAPERELEVSVATRRADVADYVARWKAQIEEVGTLYFPDAARQQRLTGSPLLEVAISADGGLRSIEVVRRSPYPVLDEAALRILRLAAPFDPFPEPLRQEYDTLRFVYEWRFRADVGVP